MSESLGVQPWMTAPATRAVFDALEAAGGDDCARFVGGCVRNTLIDTPISDIDVATRLTPDAVTAALRAGGVRALPTGVEHGTVTAVSHHQPIEVTTLRRDVETDGRRAVVAFTTDWNEDARRRDFTLNALYAGRDGRLFDPTGRGVDDARAGRIVFVGDPEQRLREDHLRSLRFFRFYAWYGRGEADAGALAAIARLKDKVAGLAAERISAELLKLLAAPEPRPAVRLMQQTGVLQVVLRIAPDLRRFEGLVAVEAQAGRDPDPMLRLAALLPDDPVAGRGLAEQLRLSNAHRDRLEAALSPLPGLTAALPAAEARACVYRLGAQAFSDRLMLGWAAEAVSDPASPDRSALLALARDWTPPVLPVNGQDALAAGAAKGPAVGEALRRLEAWWVEGDFAADREEALTKLKALCA
jgi:poly(A) polymerase